MEIFLKSGVKKKIFESIDSFPKSQYLRGIHFRKEEIVEEQRGELTYSVSYFSTQGSLQN